MHREFFTWGGNNFIAEYNIEKDGAESYPVDTVFSVMETWCHEVRLRTPAIIDVLESHFEKNVFPGLVASAEHERRIERLEQCEGGF
jgi:hypothetical protein